MAMGARHTTWTFEMAPGAGRLLESAARHTHLCLAAIATAAGWTCASKCPQPPGSAPLRRDHHLALCWPSRPSHTWRVVAPCAASARRSIVSALGFSTLQERVFNIPGFSYPGWMTFITYITYATCGGLECLLTRQLSRHASLRVRGCGCGYGRRGRAPASQPAGTI